MHCQVDEQLQNELAVRFHVSLQCVSCELKFLLGSVFSETFSEKAGVSFPSVEIRHISLVGMGFMY